VTVHGDVTKRSAPPGVRCGRTHNIGPPLCISWRPATDTIGLLLDLRTRGQSVFTDRMEPLAPSPDAAADADAAAAAADSPVDVRMRRPTLSERRYGTRVARLLLGLVLCGLGIAVMVAADLGLGPWDVLHQGISGFVPLEIGAVGIVVGFVVLALWIPLKERPGIGTILNVIVIGVVIDTVLLWLDTPDTMAARIALLLSGPLLFGVGSGFYIGARIGTGPRDGLMTGPDRHRACRAHARLAAGRHCRRRHAAVRADDRAGRRVLPPPPRGVRSARRPTADLTRGSRRAVTDGYWQRSLSVGYGLDATSLTYQPMWRCGGVPRALPELPTVPNS
jgi:hypothetical protein